MPVSKKLCPLLLFLFISIAACARPTGKVLEQKLVKSAILNRNIKYSLYLPPDYESSERSYPVVYLLHGYRLDRSVTGSTK